MWFAARAFVRLRATEKAIVNDPRNLRDLTNEELAVLPARTRDMIEQLAALGYSRRHLVLAGDNVFFDPELADLDVWQRGAE